MRGYGLIYAELRRLAGSYLRYESQLPYGHDLHEERPYSTVVVLCGLLCLCLCEPRFSSSLANLADVIRTAQPQGRLFHIQQLGTVGPNYQLGSPGDGISHLSSTSSPLVR